MTRFRLFDGSPGAVERDLNAWAETLPAGTKIRRTQLAAAAPPHVPSTTPGPTVVYALVSYDPPEPAG